MNRDRGRKNLVWSVIGQAVTVLAGLLLPYFLIRYYGSGVNGVLNSVNQVFAYFVLFEAGIGAAAQQALYRPEAEGDRSKISAIVAAAKRYYDRMALFYLAAIGVFAAVYAAFFTQDTVTAAQMVGIIVFSGAAGALNFWYQGKYRTLLMAEGKKYFISNAQSAAQVLICAAKLIAILAGADIVVVMLAGCIAQMTQTLWYVLYIRKNYRWLDLSAEPDTEALSKKNSVMVHQVSQLIFQNTDILILTVFAGFKVVSVYAVYKLVMTAISGLTFQISESFTFVLGQKYAAARDDYPRTVDAFDAGYTLISFILLTTALVMYPAFIGLYTAGATDISYKDAWLPLLFVVIEALSCCRRAMQNTIDVAGHFRQTAPRSAAEAAINLGVSLLLVRWLGMYGVLLGTIAALLYRTNDIILYSSKRLLHRNPLASYRFYLPCGAVMAAAFFLTRRFPVTCGGWGSFILTAVLCLVIVAVVYLLVGKLAFGRALSAALQFLKLRRREKDGTAAEGQDAADAIGTDRAGKGLATNGTGSTAAATAADDFMRNGHNRPKDPGTKGNRKGILNEKDGLWEKLFMIYYGVFLAVLLGTTVPWIKWQLEPVMRIFLVPAAAFIVADLIGKRRIFRDRTVWLLALFCVFYGVTVLLNRSSAFSANASGLIYMAAVFLTGYAASCGVGKRFTDLITRILLAGSFILSAVCFATWLFGLDVMYENGARVGYLGVWDGRLWGLYNANTGGTICILSILVSAALLCGMKTGRAAKRKHLPETAVLRTDAPGCRPFLWINLGLQTVCLSLHYSRTSIVVLAAVLVFWAWHARPWEKLGRRADGAGRTLEGSASDTNGSGPRRMTPAGRAVVSLAIGAGFVLCCLALHGILTALPVSDRAKPVVVQAEEGRIDVEVPTDESGELAGRGGEGGVLTGRSILWRSGARAFLDHPVFGVGRENLYDAVEPYLPAPGWRADLSAGGVHNGLLNMLICSGIAGTAVMVIFFVNRARYFLRALRRGACRSPRYLFCVSVVILFLLTELTEARLLYQLNAFFVLFWLFLGLARNERPKREHREEAEA